MTEEQILVWQHRIQKAEDLQSKMHEDWKQIMKLYLGEFFVKPTDNSGEITEVNFVFEYVKLLQAAIYARDPHIFVRARSGKFAAFAETMETVLNYYWMELKLKKKIKRTILNSVLNPPGHIELGYLFIKEKDKMDMALEREFPELKESKPLEQQGIFDETIKEDDVFANVLTAWEVLWPDGYNDIRSAPYMIVKGEVPYRDILDNPMLKPVKKEIFSSRGTTSTKPQGSFTLKDDVKVLDMTADDHLDLEDMKVTLYRVFDKRSQKRFILAKNFTKDTLWEKPWKFLSDGFPIFPLIFNEIPPVEENANSYPLSDIVPMLPQLKELSKINSAMMRHRKRAGTFIAIKKGVMGEGEAAKIAEASDVDIVELPRIDKEAMQGFTPPALPSDYYRIREVIIDDLFRISGFKQLLADSSGVETATESENIRQGALLRQQEKTDVIEDFTKEIAQYLAGLIWQFKQDRAEIAEIIGEDVSEEMWPALPENESDARRIIQKQLSFDIEAGSTRPAKDENVERKLWLDVVSAVKTQFPGRLNDDVILKQLLKKYDFKDIDQAIIGFDQEEGQAAQQENELLMQGIPVPVSPNNNHEIHIQVHAQLVNSGQSTGELEQHLLQHAQYEQLKNPAVTTGNQRRKGVPENADLVGAINNTDAGANKGGPQIG